VIEGETASMVVIDQRGFGESFRVGSPDLDVQSSFACERKEDPQACTGGNRDVEPSARLAKAAEAAVQGADLRFQS
jgi:hypothetical protein